MNQEKLQGNINDLNDTVNKFKALAEKLTGGSRPDKARNFLVGNIGDI